MRAKQKRLVWLSYSQTCTCDRPDSIGLVDYVANEDQTAYECALELAGRMSRSGACLSLRLLVSTLTLSMYGSSTGLTRRKTGYRPLRVSQSGGRIEGRTCLLRASALHARQARSPFRLRRETARSLPWDVRIVSLHGKVHGCCCLFSPGLRGTIRDCYGACAL